MKTRLSFTPALSTSRRQVKFELTSRGSTPVAVTLHLVKNLEHIFGFYFFDIGYEGIIFHADVGKKIFDAELDLRKEKKLKVIGVDLV